MAPPIREFVDLLVYKYTFVFRESWYFLGQFPLPHTQKEAKWEVISDKTAASTTGFLASQKYGSTVVNSQRV